MVMTVIGGGVDEMRCAEEMRRSLLMKPGETPTFTEEERMQ